MELAVGVGPSPPSQVKSFGALPGVGTAHNQGSVIRMRKSSKRSNFMNFCFEVEFCDDNLPVASRHFSELYI